MANQEHVEKAMQGKDVWNAWREHHPFEVPDLSRANLENTNLTDFDLKNTNFQRANLKNATLENADLRWADLGECDLGGARLNGAILDFAEFKGANLKEVEYDAEDALPDAFVSAVDNTSSDGVRRTLREFSNEGIYRRLNLRGFVVDFFGSLVPGVLFLIALTVVLIWPIWSITGEQKDLTAEITKVLGSLSAAVSIELSVLFLLVSYVVGSLFFRMDPKKPDKESAKQTIKKFTPGDREKWVVRREGSELDVQFPYKYLHSYLRERNLKHLADLITWNKSDGTSTKDVEDEVSEREEEQRSRTKTFINMLKIRLDFYFPDQCGTITKNEAHVRLMSSVWYICRYLLAACVIGLVLNGMNLYFRNGGDAGVLIKEFLRSFSVCMNIFCLFVFFFAKRKIQDFLHYQRVREIIYVLETAYMAGKHIPYLLKQTNKIPKKPSLNRPRGQADSIESAAPPRFISSSTRTVREQVGDRE